MIDRIYRFVEIRVVRYDVFIRRKGLQVRTKANVFAESDDLLR